MLYLPYFNFNEFNKNFGYKTDINGNKLINKNGIAQRKNNIPFLLFKQTFKLNLEKNLSFKQAYEFAEKLQDNQQVFKYLLKKILNHNISDVCPINSFEDYEIVYNGMCVDSDINCISYKKSGHIYKMKIGKFLNKYLDYLSYYNSSNIELLEGPLKTFFVEQFTELWKQKRLFDSSFQIVVDKDFRKNYNSECRTPENLNFRSCMDDKSNYHFYEQFDIFKAIRLEDAQGHVFARSILVDCFDSSGKAHTYLERIYCNKDVYKNLLFIKAKQNNLFDLYKGLTASCHESTEIYDLNDKKFQKTLHINILLNTDDYLSYQDTFKWYDSSKGVATNRGSFYSNLDTTNLYYVSYD